MNTPTHITLAIALLGEKNKSKKNRCILLGALVPDVAMFFLFFYEVIIGTPQRIIWNEKYFSPLWQNTVDSFNSFPIFIALLILSIYKKWHLFTAFCLAALLHVATDFPLHNDDAHRHFYPFSDWRFESPISYWDPNFYGHYWSILEIIILLVTSYITWNYISNLYIKILLVGTIIFSIIVPLLFMFLN